MEIEEAWQAMFYVGQGNSGHYLVIKKGESFSYNMILYKTKRGATKGAKAAYDKVHKEFENNFLKL